MTRNIFHRDFTLCKAAALVLLMGAALVLGGVPKATSDTAGEIASSELLLPVAFTVEDSGDAAVQGRMGIDL